MASFSTSRYLTILFLFTFFIKSLSADSNSSLNLKNFGKDSSFESFLDLYGDAKVVNGGSSVQITAPLAYSFGRMIYKKPIKVYGGIPKKLVSFSTCFSFSISSKSQNGGGALAFVVIPIEFGVNGSFGVFSERKLKFLSVEFNAILNGDSRFVFVTMGNLSSVKLALNHGEKLQTWIDYEAGSKRLEVRLSGFGEKPQKPLLFEQIDLSKISPKSENFLVGLSSSNGNSTQTCNVYSWSFNARRAPDWMHSQPLDPTSLKPKNQVLIKVPKKSDCVIKVLVALVFGIGCGALGTFVVMFTWTVFGNRRPVMPEEYSVKSVDENEHKTLKAVLEEASSAMP